MTTIMQLLLILLKSNDFLNPYHHVQAIRYNLLQKVNSLFMKKKIWKRPHHFCLLNIHISYLKRTSRTENYYNTIIGTNDYQILIHKKKKKKKMIIKYLINSKDFAFHFFLFFLCSFWDVMLHYCDFFEYLTIPK